MNLLTTVVLVALCCQTIPTAASEMVKRVGPEDANYKTSATEPENSKTSIFLSHDLSILSEATSAAATRLALSRASAMDSVLADLLVWVGSHSSYSIDQVVLPEVVDLTRERLTLEAYIDVPELLPESGVDERIHALYAYDDGTNGTFFVLQCSDSEYESVFIDYASGQMCEEENLMFQERLLHELTHHVQKVSGAEQRFTCRKFGEKEAYLLGGEFLKSHYFTDPLPIRYILAHMYSRY